MLDGPGTVPLPPVEVAVGDPAAMLARRPDIRAAAQRLHAANAGIGVAEAPRMPRVSLAGVVGLGGALQGDITSAHTRCAVAAPTITCIPAYFATGCARVALGVRGRAHSAPRQRATGSSTPP